MTDQIGNTIEKINNYLQVGGLFNPESMEHHKVSDLLLECRNELIRANSDIELMRAAILKVTEALNQGRIVPRSGVSGMTIDAQLRNSVYNGVPAGLIEDARELVEEINYRARKHNEKV